MELTKAELSASALGDPKRTLRRSNYGEFLPYRIRRREQRPQLRRDWCVGLAEDDRHIIACGSRGFHDGGLTIDDAARKFARLIEVTRESAAQRKLARYNPNLAVLKLNQRSNGGDEATEREGGPCDDKQDAEHQC